MRSLFTVLEQFLVIACMLQFLVQDIECKKRSHDTDCQSCYDDDEWSSCDPCPCGGERSSKKEFKMPKIKMPKMPKLKKSKKSKKHSNDDDDDDECGAIYSMCPQTCPQYCPHPCPHYCPQPYPQPCPPRYMHPCFSSHRMPDPCYRPPCPRPDPCYRPPCHRPCPHPCLPPEPRPPMPCPQACRKPCPLPCPPSQPCSRACATPCHPPCFESTLRSSCEPQASVQKIIVEKGPAIIQNIIFDKEFCEKYFETYGCYPAIDGLPFQLPTQHVTLGNNCDDDDCSTCVNTAPCPPNRGVCGPPPCRHNDCGRSPCNIPLLSPVSYNKYYPSPCPC